MYRAIQSTKLMQAIIVALIAAGGLATKYFQNEAAMLQERLAKTLGSAKPESGREAKFAHARQLAESASAD